MVKEKRLLFVINNMEMGGTRKGLLSLMKYIADYSEYSVDLIVLSHKGPLMKEISDNVRVIHKDKILNAVFTDISETKSLLDKSIHLGVWGLRKIFGYKNVYGFLYRMRMKRIGKISYDAAIGFQEGYCNDASLFVNAEKHFAWIHSNYETFMQYELSAGIPEYYSKFDNVFFVAEASKNTFVKYHRDIEEKCMVIKNIIDKKIIKSKVQEAPNFRFPDTKYKIVTVGRVASIKRYDRIISVAKKLLSHNREFYWVIIGDGDILEDLKEKVLLEGLENNVNFVGEQLNPYSIVANADLFVLTSESESQPLVLIEAMLVGVPVISTRFDSAVEIVDEHFGGLLCDNSTDGIYEALLQVFNDDDVLRKMKDKVKHYDYDNTSVLNQLLEKC